MRIRIPLVFLILTVMASVAPAQTLLYKHQGSPIFSIDIPEGWVVDLDFDQEAEEAGTAGQEPAIDIVEIYPQDGQKVWLGLWVPPGVEDLDQAVEYARSLEQEILTEVEAAAPRDGELNGLPVRFVEGTAKKDEDPVKFHFSFFQPRQNVVAVALWVGTPEAQETYGDDVAAMIDSLQIILF